VARKKPRRISGDGTYIAAMCCSAGTISHVTPEHAVLYHVIDNHLEAFSRRPRVTLTMA